MRVYIFSIILATLVGMNVNAQVTAPTDTLKESKELQEVVVVGANQSAKPGELTFRPTDRQKKASADGYELLRHIAMPQISVNPASDNVTTLTGGGIAMFINGMPASDIEIKNLRTANVLRIDYLDYPSDPRYMGAEHVVEFIVKLPEVGGYARLSSNFAFLSNTSAGANAYTKFIYKKVNYDLYAGWNYGNQHHLGSENRQQYSLLDSDGHPYWLEQTERSDYSRRRAWGLPLNFRMSYNTDCFQTFNTAYFSFSDIPEQTIKGTTSLSTYPDNIYRFSQSTRQNNRNAGWTGHYYYNTGSGFGFAFNGQARYSNNHYNRMYSSTIDAANPDVRNDSKENAWNVSGNLSILKYLSQAHSLSFEYFLNCNDNNIDYTGTSAFNTKLKSTNMGGTFEYTGCFPFNLRLNASASLGWVKKVIDDHTKCFLYPSIDVNASYSPAPQHQANLSVKLASHGATTAYYTADVLQSTDFLYRTGNPSLTNYPVLTCSANYTWFANRQFNMSAFGMFNGFFNPVSTIYDRYLDGRVILLSYANRSHFYRWNLGINTQYKPTDALQLQLYLAYQPATNGYIKRTVHPIVSQLNATYYLGQFFIVAYGGLGSRSLTLINGGLVRTKANYGLTLGWNNSHWNVRLYASNFLNSSWKDDYSEFIFPVYRQYSASYTGNYHRSFAVSVSYTFDYGKKVQHGDEIKADESNNSGILK